MRPTTALLLVGLSCCGGGSHSAAPSQRLLIAAVEPASSAVDVDLQPTLRIAFLEELDPESPLDECLTLTDRLGPVARTIRLDTDPTRLVVTLGRSLVLDSIVTATVSTELRTITGQRLSTPFSWSFETRTGRWHDTGSLPSAPQSLYGPQTSDGIVFAAISDQLWMMRDSNHGWKPAGTIPGTEDANGRLVFLGLEDDTTLVAGFTEQTSSNRYAKQAHARRGIGFKDWQALQLVGTSFDFLGYPITPHFWGERTGGFVVATTVSTRFSGASLYRALSVVDANGTYQMLRFDEGFSSTEWRFASSQHGGGRASVVHHWHFRHIVYTFVDANKGGLSVDFTIATDLAQEQVTGLDVIACPHGRAKVLIARTDAPGPRLECWRFEQGVSIGSPQTLWSGQVRAHSMELAKARTGNAMLVFTGPKPASTDDGQWVSYYDAALDAWSEPLLLDLDPARIVVGRTPRIADQGDAALFVTTALVQTGEGTLTLLRYQPGIGFRPPEPIAGITSTPPPSVLQATMDDKGRITLFLRNVLRTLRYE